MGYKRRLRRHNERLLRTQDGAAVASDMGVEPEPAVAQPVASGWLARASAMGATAIGVAAGAVLGGPVGAVVFGGIGAAVDWARR